MKKKILIVLSIVVILIVLTYGIIVYVDYHKTINGELPVFARLSDNGKYQGLGYTVEVSYYPNTDSIEKIDMKFWGKQIAGIVQYIETSNEEKVIIENGTIQNENKIDAFMEKVDNGDTANLQILVIEEREEDYIQVEFIQGKHENQTDSEGTNTVNMQVPSSHETSEEYQQFYGYYKISINGEETGAYDVLRWKMKTKTKDNIVQVIMEPYLIEITEMPIICEYTLESSAYKKMFELTYEARKDMGVKTVAQINQFDNIDFGIYTIAGDVTITVEEDMVYSLEEALAQHVITVQDILDQIQQDEKYGFCQKAYYSDGGSAEYLYSDYTILKYNTLDGNKDLIIGMKGSIMKYVNESGYRTKNVINSENV